jgi:choline transport protein
MDLKTPKLEAAGKYTYTHSSGIQLTSFEEQQLCSVVSVGNGTVQSLAIEGAPAKTQFSKWNIIAFAFVICNSWAGVAGSIQLALLQGGPATLIYSVILSSIAYMCIAISLAELASVYPTAGGQYHFASILAPKKIRRGVSYACGLLSMFSWVAIGAAVTIIPAQQIMALVSALNPTFETKQWHVFLIYEGVAAFILANNLFLLKKAPWIHNIGCKSAPLLQLTRRHPFPARTRR